MDPQNPNFTILMFPWIAHGHIFPYLELSKALLTRKNFHILFCTTAVNFDSIKNFINKNSLQESIELIELKLEPNPNLPPHFHTTKNLPNSLIPSLIKAFQTSHSSFSDIIGRIKPNLVIYDMFQPWASKIAALERIPSVHFSIFGGGILSYVHHLHSFRGKPFPFKGMRFEDHEVKSLNSTNDFLFANVHDSDRDDFLFGNFKQSRDVVLIKASRGLEGKYVDYLSSMSEKKIVPLGPLTTDNKLENVETDDTIKWLSKKDKNSTLFISFGSEYFLSEYEIGEIAKALLLCSGINFIWVIRSPSDVSITANEVLPRGFMERVGERGLVVTGWAPQASILGHENTGGFVSHCGWSSIMESVYYGVPVVAMAMKVDQPVNARMLAEAGGCVEVGRKEGGGYEAEEIARAIGKVMGESGGEMRRAMSEFSEMVKREGGELDGAAEELWRICLYWKNAKGGN